MLLGIRSLAVALQLEIYWVYWLMLGINCSSPSPLRAGRDNHLH